MRGFSTDRPTKSTVPFTVDAGHFQYEMDIANGYYLRNGVVTTNSIVGPNPWLKIGITSNIDFEVNTPAPQRIDTHDLVAGTWSRAEGFNDTYMRLKVNLWGNDGGRSAFALIPWIKAPTAAAGLGNGATEAGLIASLSFSLPAGTTLLSNFEADSLKDSSGGGYHANTTNLINISTPIFKDVTLYAELWSSLNFDPARTIRQMSFDTALAWGVTKNTQIDFGANIGLTRDTPAIQLYAGLSQRF